MQITAEVEIPGFPFLLDQIAKMRFLLGLAFISSFFDKATSIFPLFYLGITWHRFSASPWGYRNIILVGSPVSASWVVVLPRNRRLNLDLV